MMRKLRWGTGRYSGPNWLYRESFIPYCCLNELRLSMVRNTKHLFWQFVIRRSAYQR